MYVVRSSSLPTRSARRVAFLADAVKTLPKAQLSIADGLVSVTQQSWAASRQCSEGFSSDAA